MFFAVQLDLARQIETVETICNFIDLAVQSGLNMLVLYLEDRIKTQAYPYNSDKESYSIDQVQAIVHYAEERNIELMPIISNFGHTERFLQHKKLSHIAELRGGIPGRFSQANSIPSVVCPSMEETYAFFNEYIAQVAKLFPSKYFHVGLDEIWDIGYCELCSERIKDEGCDGIFLKHILRTHRLLTSLGKTMMMWDDMFEIYPTILERIPKDIVLFSWHYDFVVDKLAGHFNNRRMEDVFSLYDELGFSYVTSFYVGNPYNMQTFISYSMKHHPIGYLATIWEQSRDVLLHLEPAVYSAGLLFRGNCTSNVYIRLAEAIKCVTGISSDRFARLASTILLYDYVADSALLDEVLQNDYKQMMSQDLLFMWLQEYDSFIGDKQPGEDYLAAFRLQLLYKLIAAKIQKIAVTLFEYRSNTNKVDISDMRLELQQCMNWMNEADVAQMHLWNKYRRGLDNTRHIYENMKYKKAICDLGNELKASEPGEFGMLLIRYFIPDYTGQPKAEFIITYVDGTQQIISCKHLKYFSIDPYARMYRLHADKDLERVQINTWGYGAVGIRYIYAVNQRGTYIPKQIVNKKNHVINPDHILEDDTRSCILGDELIVRPFIKSGCELDISSITVLMIKASIR